MIFFWTKKMGSKMVARFWILMCICPCSLTYLQHVHLPYSQYSYFLLHSERLLEVSISLFPIIFNFYAWNFFRPELVYIFFKKIFYSVCFFLRMSTKSPLKLARWSDYSSPVATQRTSNIGNPWIACGYCLEYCNLCYFFSNWRYNFSVVCDEVCAV